MSDMTIITNHHRREIIDAWELTAKEREEFDYLDWEAIEKGEDSASFVRYRGELIDMGDVLLCTDPTLTAQGWQGFNADSFWSGMAFKYVRDEATHDYCIVVARVHW